jgi:hypothetical protein
MPNSRKLGIAAAILLFLITVGAAFFVVKSYMLPDDMGEPAPPPAPSASTASVPVGDQIRVGVFLSNFSATGPHRQATPYGYDTQLRAVHTLHDPAIHLVPVIEAGSARMGQLPSVLSRNFPGEKPLIVKDIEDMRKIDVLVATATANVWDPASSTIIRRVREGMGLLVRQFGYLSPGYNENMSELNGFAQATFGWSANPVQCEVVGSNPLLGDLSGKIGQTISLTPNGVVGELRGIPLLRVKDMRQIMLVNAKETVGTGEYLYPLYISQLGQGKIVGIGYTQGKDVPPELEAANHDRFYIHCVQWLAGKPLQ